MAVDGFSSARPLPIYTCSMILFVPQYQVGMRVALSLRILSAPEGSVGKSAAADGPAALQIQVADIAQLERAVHLLRIVAVIDHRVAAFAVISISFRDRLC